MSGRLVRVVGGVVLGSMLGLLSWAGDTPFGGGSLAVEMAIWASIAAVLGLMSDLPFFPSREVEWPTEEEIREARAATAPRPAPAAAPSVADPATCPHCGAPGGSGVWCASCGRLTTGPGRPSGVVIPRIDLEEEPARGGAAAPATLAAAFCVAFLAVPLARSGWLVLRASYGFGGERGFFLLDGLAFGIFGIFGWCAGVFLVAAAVGAAVIAAGLVARHPTARTASLWYLAIGIPVSAAFLFQGGSLLGGASLLASAAGLMLLFLPSTDRDFDGRWGKLFAPRRRFLGR